MQIVRLVEDDDGQQYPTRSVIVEGTYYQQTKIDINGVIFTDYMPDQNVLHYGHLVIETRLHFDTLPKKGCGPQKWRMPIKDHKNILEIIKDREDPDFMYHELT